MSNLKEKSVCFVIETSVHSEHFLPAIKEMLINFLHEKSSLSDKFLFNIGHFDKETVFWADQVTECTLESAKEAAHWIRELTVSKNQLHNSNALATKPRMLAALISALSDPFVNAVFFVAASTPFESTSDVLNHVKYASKGRPVHVQFLTMKNHVDYAAMEILHLISKETKGTFRIAYSDKSTENSTDRLIEIVPKSDHFFKTENENSDASSLSTTPLTLEHLTSVLSPTKNDTKLFDHVPLSPEYDVRNSFMSPSSAGSQSLFGDLKITLKNHHIPYAGKQEKFVVTAHNPNNKYGFKMLPKDKHDYSLVNPVPHIKNRFESEPDILEKNEIDEIRNLFAAFYTKKQKSETQRSRRAKTYMALTNKLIDFHPKIDSARSLSVSSVSDTITSDTTQKNHVTRSQSFSVKKRRKKHAHGVHSRAWKAASRDRSSSSEMEPEKESAAVEKVYHTPKSLPRTPRVPSASRSLSSHGRLIRPRTVSLTARSKRVPAEFTQQHVITARSLLGYSPVPTARSAFSSSTKRSWIPAAGGKREFLTSGTIKHAEAISADRSSAWMNRWMNEWVKRHEPVNAQQIHTHTSGPKSASKKLQLNTYTQTGAPNQTQAEEVHTIRELLRQNNVLMDALIHPDETHSKMQIPPRSKMVTPRRRFIANASPHATKPLSDWEQLAKVAEAKKNVNDEIKRLSNSVRLTERNAYSNQLPIARYGKNASRWDQVKKTRQDLIQETLKRKEDIKRQQQETCYKAMYQKLAQDVQTHRSLSNAQENARKQLAGAGMARAIAESQAQYE